MKLYYAYSCYLVCLGTILVISTLRHHALTNYVRINNRNKDDIAGIHDNVMYCDANDEIINPHDFVFFNAAALVNFEHQKKERARNLLEQLCGIKKMDIKKIHIQRNLFSRVGLYATNQNNKVYVQQFGIPCAVDKNMLMKKIATKQLAEKNILPKKRCILSALEKLLE